MFEQRIARLEEKVSHMESRQEEIYQDVKAVRSTLDRVGGMWKAMVVISGLMAAVGGMAVKLFDWLKH